MNIRFVSFEDIDKNKWNGTVHFAHNSNIYGYYWYLKSVIKEWDALVEDDYHSVMPLPRYKWSSFQLNLLPGLGAYSVNTVSETRALAFYELFKKYCPGFGYIFNPGISSKLIGITTTSLTPGFQFSINLNHSYQDICNKYSSAFNYMLSKHDLTNYAFGSQEKPEVFLQNSRLSKENKNILYRLYYNAIQRSIGWHSKVRNLKTENDTSAFFISDASNIYLIFSNQTDMVSILVLIDTFLQTNAGKPRSLWLGSNKKLAEIFGAESTSFLEHSGSFWGLSGKIKKIMPRFFE